MNNELRFKQQPASTQKTLTITLPDFENTVTVEQALIVSAYRLTMQRDEALADAERLRCRLRGREQADELTEAECGRLMDEVQTLKWKLRRKQAAVERLERENDGLRKKAERRVRR